MEFRDIHETFPSWTRTMVSINAPSDIGLDLGSFASKVIYVINRFSFYAFLTFIYHVKRLIIISKTYMF